MNETGGTLKRMTLAGLALALAVYAGAADGRIPIATAAYTISAPGDYYLTADLSYTSGNPIQITASGVNLDLNGHTISAGASSNYCVSASGYTNIRVFNGNLSGGAAGLSLTSASAGVLAAENLTVTGFSGVGINMNGAGSQPEVMVTGNRVTCNGATGSDGIDLTQVWGGRVAHNILVGKSPSTGGWGISLTMCTSLWVAENTVTYFWQGIGINSGTALSIVRNNSSHNSYGIVVQSAANTLDIEENFTASNVTTGIQMSPGVASDVYRNNVSQSNGGNYFITGATDGGGNL